MSTLQELKQEADELGLSYAKNVSANKLQEKIEEFYESKETSGPALEAVVAKEESKPKTSAEARLSDKINKAKAKAEETRIVTIIDNDQRVNNQTTTCTVNCSNEYFDLGTIILPLNEKIEVRMGHLKTLEQVQIPLHMRDNKTGLSTVKMRPRYTISYEDR
jgi:hypothetical protein